MVVTEQPVSGEQVMEATFHLGVTKSLQKEGVMQAQPDHQYSLPTEMDCKTVNHFCGST